MALVLLVSISHPIKVKFSPKPCSRACSTSLRPTPLFQNYFTAYTSSIVIYWYYFLVSYAKSGKAFPMNPLLSVQLLQIGNVYKTQQPVHSAH